jgi:flagellar biosynthesis chaperone FliJ
MAMHSEDALPTARREVQRLLGRCLLRLQQYERQIKAIIAHREISGPADDLEAAQVKRESETGGKTLGVLVRDLMGSFLVDNDGDATVEDRPDDPDTGRFVRVRVRLTLSRTDYLTLENDLRELVSLRNDLVHHFIDQHDLRSPDGCLRAQAALRDAHDRIDHHLTRLRQWAEDMDRCRRLAAEQLQSPEFLDLVVNGIGPDGAVDWPDAGIVRALREAAGALAVGGWVPVAAAASWIAERYPEQTPVRYGCGTLRQVIHESRVFELRRIDQDGKRQRFYRVREVAGESGP